jgi:WD40 repeat protein
MNTTIGKSSLKTHHFPLITRHSLLYALLLIFSLVLTACGESSPTTGPSSGAAGSGKEIPAPASVTPNAAATSTAIANIQATEIASEIFEIPAGAIQLEGTPTPTPTVAPTPVNSFNGTGWPQLLPPYGNPTSAQLIGQISSQIAALPNQPGITPGPNQKAPFTALAISPDNSVLALADREQIWLCEASTGKVLQVLYATSKQSFTGQPGDTEERGAASLSWSPDGKKLAAGTWHGEVIMWRWEAARQQMRPGRNTFQPYNGAAVFGDAVEVAFGPDSVALAGFSSSGSITVWDSETLQVRSSFYSPYAGYLSWSPDGKKLVDEYLNVHYLESGQTFNPDEKAIVSDEQPQGVAWSPNGKQIAVSADGFELGLVDAPPADKRTWISAELKKIVPPRTTTGPAYDHYREGRRVVWSPDGRWVAVANMPGAGKISIWDSAGQKLLTITSGNAILTGLVWPTPAVIVAAGNDGVARFWHLIDPATPTPGT